MSASTRGTRGPAILNLLWQHGPLTHEALLYMLEPPIKKRRLQMATERLMRNGLIHKRYSSLHKNMGQVIELNQTQVARVVLADKLRTSPEQLILDHFRSQELLHSIECAIWTEFLKRLLPEAEVVRDFQYGKLKWIESVLRLKAEEADAIPDILVRHPSKYSKGSTYIAVEIERSRKTDDRLIRKLRRITHPSRVDGILYVCENNFVESAVRRIYLNEALPRARFIRHYGNHYLVFARVNPERELKDVGVFNAEQNHLSLKNWVNFLVHTAPPDRGLLADLEGASSRS